MIQLINYLKGFVKEQEEGQALVEYALIVALVSVVTIALLAALGTSIGGVLTDITSALP